MDTQKAQLLQAIQDCIENGQRLQQDAEALRINQSVTEIALCILAQEEFAKAFLLQLVYEGSISWSPQVRDTLHRHNFKQLVGLIMEWLSPSDDEFSARWMAAGAGRSAFPTHIADATTIFVEKISSRGQKSFTSAVNDPVLKSIINGDRDKIKQDAFYVRLSNEGKVISTPSQFTLENIEAERDRTNRLSDLVRPLRDGSLLLGLDYNLFVDYIRFLFLDKTNRPFLILNKSEFGGSITTSTGLTYPHSINVQIDNISDELAILVSGYATVFLDKEVVKPFFSFDAFTMEPHVSNLCTFLMSEETYDCGISESHQLEVSINLEYKGIISDQKYHAWVWSIYDPKTKIFRETLTDSQNIASDGSQPITKTETRWRLPSKF
jgi:AbiV family abortive infection protein